LQVGRVGFVGVHVHVEPVVRVHAHQNIVEDDPPLATHAHHHPLLVLHAEDLGVRRAHVDVALGLDHAAVETQAARGPTQLDADAAREIARGADGGIDPELALFGAGDFHLRLGADGPEDANVRDRSAGADQSHLLDARELPGLAEILVPRELLAHRGRFPAAHADVLLSDDTPDIPLRSSDVYLAELLLRKAPSPQGDAAFVDTLLRPALATAAAAPTAQLVEHIAARYGVARPASLTELDGQVKSLVTLLDQLDADARTWEAVLGDFNRANLDAFLGERPAWRERVGHAATSRLDPAARRTRALALLSELHSFLAADAARLAEANRLVAGFTTAEELGYRTDIRVAALLRVRFTLTSLAGRHYVGQHPSEAEAFEALVRCEDLVLAAKAPLPVATAKAEPTRLPSLDEDRRRAAAIRPGWLGITFVPVGKGRRARLKLAEGAATITSVLDGSPAAAAGLRRGDILLGAPARPFTHRNDVRPFIAAASPGAPLALEVVRGERRMVVTPVVREAPEAQRR